MIPKKGMNPALRRITEDRRLINAAHKANMLLTLMVLRDEFGFGNKRAERFLDKYKDVLDSYEKGYINVEDLRSTLEDELKIEIKL